MKIFERCQHDVVEYFPVYKSNIWKFYSKIVIEKGTMQQENLNTADTSPSTLQQMVHSSNVESILHVSSGDNLSRSWYASTYADMSGRFPVEFAKWSTEAQMAFFGYLQTIESNIRYFDIEVLELERLRLTHLILKSEKSLIEAATIVATRTLHEVVQTAETNRKRSRDRVTTATSGTVSRKASKNMPVNVSGHDESERISSSSSSRIER